MAKIKTKAAFSIKKLSKRRKIAIVAIAVVSILAISDTIWFFVDSSNDSAAGQKTSELIEKISTAVDDATKLAHNGKLDEAIALYDSIIKTINDGQQKADLLMAKATIYFNDGDYEKALVFAKKSENIIQNETISYFIAQIYEAKGDKTNAAVYYKKAISLISKSSFSAAGDLEYYKSKVVELGGVND